MKTSIALLTILTDYVPDMLKLYTEALGFTVKWIWAHMSN